MENEDPLLARLVDFCRAALREYSRFVWAFYGGVGATEAGDLARQTSGNSLEGARWTTAPRTRPDDLVDAAAVPAGTTGETPG
nr:hypothetical protein GA0070560_104329 [uncultured bacterium]